MQGDIVKAVNKGPTWKMTIFDLTINRYLKLIQKRVQASKDLTHEIHH